MSEVEKNQRGRKFCPQCSTATGPRAFNCAKCNYDFFPDKEKKPKVVYQGLNKGQKKCLNCDKINAARQHKCECGFSFQEKKVIDVVFVPTVSKKVVVEVQELDWKTLNVGDVIEVLSGAGDHYINDSGKVYMADFGEYTVYGIKPTGILAIEYNGNGTAFFNMIDNIPSITSSMIKKEKHKIRMIQKV